MLFRVSDSVYTSTETNTDKNSDTNTDTNTATNTDTNTGTNAPYAMARFVIDQILSTLAATIRKCCRLRRLRSLVPVL